MRYILAFLGVLLIVGFMNSLADASFDQNRATGLALGIASAKASLREAAKLFCVGLLLIKLLLG
jgi:hypothetical protein